MVFINLHKSAQVLVAIIAILTMLGLKAQADTLYVPASEIHIKPGKASYVLFRVNNTLSNMKFDFDFLTALPVHSQNAGDISEWAKRWLTDSTLKLAIPGDVARNLYRLKNDDPALAKAYFNTDSWVIKITYEVSPGVALKADPNYFPSLSEWMDYISKADKIANLVQKHADQIEEVGGELTKWVEEIADVVGEAVEWLLGLVGPWLPWLGL